LFHTLKKLFKEADSNLDVAHDEDFKDHTMNTNAVKNMEACETPICDENKLCVFTYDEEHDHH